MIFPDNPMVIPINIAYMLISTFIWFLLFRSYKPNATMSTTVYPAYIIFVLRQLARIIEIANNSYPVEIINAVVLFLTVTYTFYMTVFIFSFYNLRGSYFIFLVTLVAASMLSKYAYN
jgi:hypothetical protein